MHGRGPLTAANGFADQGEVLVKTRLAADAVGATPMDRPEWTSVDRRNGTVYLTLTNNKSSSKEENEALAADPYRTDSNGAPEIRRFLTGVKGCEVTGVTMTPDPRTMSINIQHPGNGSTWPQGDGFTTPRSSTVIVRKNDGGVIGT